MADNTAQTGAATIAADDVTTLNGGASTGVLVQRVKVAYGDDNIARDVSESFPLPIALDGDTTAGTITNAAAESVTTTAGSVVSAGTYRAIVFENVGTDYVYIGATGVTTVSYFKRLSVDEVFIFSAPFVPANAIFAIAATGTQSVRIGLVT